MTTKNEVSGRRQSAGSKAAERTTPSRIERMCADRGLRMTGQRRTIARVLTDAEDHPDVVEVFRRANIADPRISMSTVYRTLRLLEDQGILERRDFGAGRRRYEEATREHHDHLIDIETGRVIEFRNEDIEKLQERVARELGFELVGHRLELHGVPLKRKKS
jgi:Fur family ferric uptake transcriptional regulator